MANQFEKIATYKDIMGNYPTGVTVLTALDSDNQALHIIFK